MRLPRFRTKQILYFLATLITLLVFYNWVRSYRAVLEEDVPYRVYIPKDSPVLNKLDSRIVIPKTKDVTFNFKAAMAVLNGEKIKHDDPRLLRLLSHYYFDYPALTSNKTHGESDTSLGQAVVVDNIFKAKKNGFFVECGAYDGEKRSNTKFLERERDWNGLLIEADPDNYKKLLANSRKAYLLNACLTVTNTPSMMHFRQQEENGRIVTGVAIKSSHVIQVQCFPLYSVLAALGRTSVDYLSLDVGGDELQILSTIPFGQLDIKLISVEVGNNPKLETSIKLLLERNGYTAHLKISRYDNTVNCIIFTKRTLQ